ncbi:MAG: fatty acyl-AMP ligase [Myxococcaceae bacterium]
MSVPSRLVGAAQPPPRHASILEALRRAAEHPSGLTFVDASESEETLLWSEVRTRARATAGALRRLGVRAGDRVAIVLPTAPDFMDAFFGSLLAGAVPVPLYPPVRLGRLEEYHKATARMLQLSGAVLVLTDGLVGRLLGQAVAAARPRLGCHRVGPLREAGETPFEQPVEPQALAAVQFSSGSTVDPKPVALSHANVMAQVETIRSLMPVRDGVRPLGVSWLPLYHDMGLIGCLVNAVAYPGPLVLLRPEQFLARPALWLRALSRHRGTLSAAPSFAYALCVRRIRSEELEGVDLSSWALALNGAESISAEVARRFVERFSPYGFDPRALVPAYGLAEASLAVAFAPSRSALRTVSVNATALAAEGQVRPGNRTLVSVGRPVPGAEVEIREESGAVVPLGTVGRIHVRGPSVMVGYLDQPEATRSAVVEGWLDTGDLGFVADGELVVCGRAKDVIVLRGANHVPQEFEEALEGLAGVRAGCAVALGAIPPGLEGEELVLLVELGLGAPGDLADQIRTRVLERTGIRPHSVELLTPGTLPRTSSGKLRRREALRRWQTGTLTPPRKVRLLGLAGAMLKSAVAFARADRDP